MKRPGIGIIIGLEKLQLIPRYATRPLAHVGRVEVIAPTEVAHLKSPALDEHHVVDGGHDLLQQCAAF
ncbi:hypothetical protein D3C78_1802880 [compost metagenome]